VESQIVVAAAVSERYHLVGCLRELEQTWRKCFALAQLEVPLQRLHSASEHVEQPALDVAGSMKVGFGADWTYHDLRQQEVELDSPVWELSVRRW
jgi:hypothetical protein